MIRAFLSQAVFLTRFPVPASLEFNENDLVRGVPFAPVIGMLTGLIPACAYYFLSGNGLNYLAAASAVILQIIITGALHLDGLADTADGFFSCREKERILEIMRDSRIGTNGVIALIAVIMMKFCVIISLPAERAVLYIVAVPAAARMTIAWSACISPYARSEEGMGKAVVEKTGVKGIVLSTLVSVVIISVVLKFETAALTVLVAAAAALCALLFARYSYNKIGGITGDVIGAIIELTETALFLLLLAVETFPALQGFL